MSGFIRFILIDLVILILGIMALFFFVSRRNEQVRGQTVEHFPAVFLAHPKKALLVYQPSALGKSMDRLVQVMTEQLQAAGFSVDRTFAGEHVLKLEDEYDLMLFGSSVYMGNMSRLLLSNLDDMIEREAVVGLFSLGLHPDDSPELAKATELPGVNPDRVMKFISTDKKLEQKVTSWLIEILYMTG